ncbi:MAG: hypothetical protein ACYTFU_11415 [Planctomycetota bacterium]|jgi:hypothetical protein
MNTKQYKPFTITRDMLPLNETTCNYKVGGFVQHKQFDLADQLDYCFKRLETPIQVAEKMNVPSNDTALLARFTQTNNVVDTINDVQESTTTATTATATADEYGRLDKPDQPSGVAVQLAGEGSEA